MQQQEHWAKQQESGSYSGIRFLLFCYRIGGKFLILLVLAPVLWYFVCSNSRARQSSLKFLQKVHQQLGAASPFQSTPGYRQAYLHFRSFALEALAKIDGWLGRIPSDHIQQQGQVQFADLVASGKGGILMGSHLGNLELCRAMSAGKYHTRIHVLVFTRHAAAFNKALRQANPQVEVNLIQVDSINPVLVMQLKEWVEQNEFIVIVGDRISVTAPERMIYAPFLGEPAPFAIGPWVLASVLECPVHLMFCMREGRWKKWLLRWSYPGKTGSRRWRLISGTMPLRWSSTRCVTRCNGLIFMISGSCPLLPITRIRNSDVSDLRSFYIG